MPNQRRSREAAPEPTPAIPAEEQVWLRADYLCHVFHYRMPETVAIASVNPVVPSPLTVKMAIIAALLRDGQIDDATSLAPLLPSLIVKISPPESALVFRALMRYVRPRSEKDRREGKISEQNGSAYYPNPHTREFALWGGRGQDGPPGILSVFLRVPQSQAEVVERALWHIGYLGAKDSLVACIDVRREEPPAQGCIVPVREDGIPGRDVGNFVVRLADLRPGSDISLLQLIPSQRVKKHYIPNPEDKGLFVLPGEMFSYGRVKFYRKVGSPR